VKNLVLYKLKSTRILFVIFALFSFSDNLRAQGNDNEPHHLGINKNKFDSVEKWSYHFQLTTIMQAHPGFNALYSGKNSLQDTSESALSLTTTFFLGRKLWKGAAVYFNPEIAGGSGVSYALGLAGAANGETFRIGSPAPRIYVARAFIQQHFAIGGSKTERQNSDQNQLADSLPASRITISAGKFSLADFFDDNAYSHDPRSEFMNWALMSNGAWDYPANTRGYTWGGVIELIKPGFAIRVSSSLVGLKANGPTMDVNITKAHAETIEFEKKLNINGHPGSVRVLAFENFSSAPSYKNAIHDMENGDSNLVAVASGAKPGPYYGGLKYGFGISAWQELSKTVGVFMRAGWNDGKTVTWAFTEIDRSVSAGLSFTPTFIKRPNDEMGIAAVVNDISQDHYNYLNLGGYGFMLGDGRLTNYGNETIIEYFYKVRLTSSFWLTADYQFIMNPGYNKDRGPVHVFAGRLHIEF
jgi:high affinity Mn2+ porin